MHGFRRTHTQSKGVGGRRRSLQQPLELTELSPGLLQLLDLVLQDEHGHGERQQRQQLQLGRHHDSEQPHQIIQIEDLVSPCSEEETLETHTHIHTRTLGWRWLQSG